MGDAAFFRDFIAALKREMTAAGQSVTHLGVSWKGGVATLPLRGGKRFELLTGSVQGHPTTDPSGSALVMTPRPAGQSVTRLGVSWKRGVATLPLRGKQRFEIRREHVGSNGGTPEEMAAAVYAEYLHVRSGAEDA